MVPVNFNDILPDHLPGTASKGDPNIAQVAHGNMQKQGNFSVIVAIYVTSN